MKSIRIMFAMVVLLFIAGCGGSRALIAATVDLTGTWQIIEIVTQASGVCAGTVGDDDEYTAEVVQNGNNLTVTLGNDAGQASGSTFTGTISGDEIDWSGSFPSDGGTTTVTGTDITATDTSLSGTANWDWTDGFDSCSGKTQVSGLKL